MRTRRRRSSRRTSRPEMAARATRMIVESALASILGLAVAALLPPSAATAQTYPHGLALNNVAIAVDDPEAMADWYGRHLGFTLASSGRFDAVGADYIMLQAPGFQIELITRESPKVPVDRADPPDHLDRLGLKALVFDVDCLPQLTETLQAAEVEIVWALQPLFPDRRSTLIRDPEGNLVNLVERPASMKISNAPGEE